MNVATIRIDGGTSAARIEKDRAVRLPFADVRALLECPGSWISEAACEGEAVALADVDYAPLVPQPDKIVCVGLNYRRHAEETGLALPEYPMLFAKYSRALIGANDDIVLPPNSDAVDWEAELGIVIGKEVRYADENAAASAIAGYTVVNDISMRDWQMRTPQFLQGKTFEASTPVGPCLTTLDEFDNPDDLLLTCDVDDVRMQSIQTSGLIFSPVALIAYISQFISLVPGDLICTGTDSGVGFAMAPPVYLRAGSVVRTSLQGVGLLENRCVSGGSGI